MLHCGSVSGVFGDVIHLAMTAAGCQGVAEPAAGIIAYLRPADAPTKQYSGCARATGATVMM
jgi:hypothetical protein